MGEMSQKAVIQDIKIKDIRIGDRLKQDINGYSGVLLYTGQVISHRELDFLRKQIVKTKPKYAPEHYTINAKAPGQIVDRAGNILVRGGQQITEEALKPLLSEGFQVIPGPEGTTMYWRKGEWPDHLPWHIDQFNPLIRVETFTYLDDKGHEVADPRGTQVSVGEGPKVELPATSLAPAAAPAHPAGPSLAEVLAAIQGVGASVKSLGDRVTALETKPAAAAPSPKPKPNARNRNKTAEPAAV